MASEEEIDAAWKAAYRVLEVNGYVEGVDAAVHGYLDGEDGPRPLPERQKLSQPRSLAFIMARNAVEAAEKVRDDGS